MDESLSYRIKQQCDNGKWPLGWSYGDSEEMRRLEAKSDVTRTVNMLVKLKRFDRIENEKLKLAACGIDCNECSSYKVTMEQDLKAAEKMLPWFRSQGLIGESEGAEAVVKKAPFCTGCWNIADDCYWVGCNKCNLRICCTEKQIDHCGECSDFPCEPYIKFASGGEVYKKAMEYLLSLRQAESGDISQ